ncbi:MAG: hypothetical protein ACE145_11685 [Terriglobia bacterium]
MHPLGGWAVARQGIYLLGAADAQGRSDLGLYKFATGETSKLVVVARRVDQRIAISPDERTILHGQFDQTGSDLMLVENFR